MNINILQLRCTEDVRFILPSLDLTDIDKSHTKALLEYYKIRDSFLKDTFESVLDEIHYFKILKPSNWSKVLFFQHVSRIIKSFPLGGRAMKMEYLLNEQNNLKHFSLYNKDFIAYCRSGQTTLDEFYFTRKYADQNNTILVFNQELNISSSTGYDAILATYLAFEKLEDFIQWQIDDIDNPPKQEVAQNSSLHWTESKVAMIELIYALHAKGSIKGDIKASMQAIAKVFDTDLGDYYKAYIEIKARKNSTTKFINQLQVALKNRILNDDAI